MAKVAEVTQGNWTGLCGDVVKETKELVYVRRPGGGSVPVARGSVVIIELQPATPVVTLVEEHPADFSHSGLGIGGLANYEEAPVIPSVQALERVQRMHDTDVVCRRCGASKNFDGAMFTTGGRNICDDCF